MFSKAKHLLEKKIILFKKPIDLYLARWYTIGVGDKVRGIPYKLT